MENSVAAGLPYGGGGLLAAMLVLLFLVWRTTLHLRPVAAFFQRFRWGGAFIDFAIAPAAAFGVGGLVQWVLGQLGLEAWRAGAREVTELLITLAIAAGTGRLIEVWLLSQEQGVNRARLSQIARGGLYGACFFVALIVFLSINGYAPTELYISGGAAAALLAFAMQQTLGDLFSGIALSIEKPFRIGDWLRFDDGTEGEVVDINWRATRLRGWDNMTIVVPNGQLSRQKFMNLHGPDHLFAPWYYVKVAGEADPQQVKALLQDAASRCGSVLRQPAPVARLTDGTTTPYTYMVWVHFRNYPAMFAGREELYREIRYALAEAGLETAAPIQEIRHRALPETPVPRPVAH